MKNALQCRLALVMLLGSTLTAQEQAEISPANKLYQQAVIEGVRASKLERRGKRDAAIDAYESAGRLAEASVAEADRTGMAQETRPPEVYFLCAISYLHAGRLLSSSKRSAERWDKFLEPLE